MSTSPTRRHAGGRPATGQMPQFQLRMPAEWLPVIDRLAKEQGTTRSGLIRSLVGRYLKSLDLQPKE